MPLFDTKVPVSNVPQNPNLRPEPYRAIAVDSKFEPPTTLLTHVEGSKWIAKEYYSQFLTADNESASQELNRPEVYQQYLRIRDLELRVTSALQPSQDSDSKEFTMVGTATLFPGIIPVNGDLFVADVGDGRAGIFVITEIRQLSVLRNTVYEINYELKHYATEILLDDLRNKISKDTTFVRDFYRYGKNPLLVDSELDNYNAVLSFRETLPLRYFELFYNHDYSTLLVPDQIGTVYDPFVTELLVKMIDRDKHLKWKDVKILNRDERQSVTIATFWDALFNHDEEIINYANFEFHLVTANSFSGQPRFASVRYSGIGKVYYPKFEHRPGVGDLQPSSERTFSRPIDLDDIVAEALDGLEYPGITLPTLQAIKPVTVDNYYVLSDAFYQVDYSRMSLLEVMVTAYLDKRPVGLLPLLQLCKASTYWNRLEQFYYIPILILLLQASIGDIN